MGRIPVEVENIFRLSVSYSYFWDKRSNKNDHEMILEVKFQNHCDLIPGLHPIRVALGIKWI